MTSAGAAESSRRPSSLIDARQPRLGQGITGVVALLAYLLQLPVVLPIMAVVMGAASLGGPKTNVYAWIFKALRPRLGPPKLLEEPWPPRFANLCGFVFFGGATLAYYALDAPGVAWGIDLVVAALALLSATTGLCIGCEAYVIGRRIATRGRIATKTVVVAPQAGGASGGVRSKSQT